MKKTHNSSSKTRSGKGPVMAVEKAGLGPNNAKGAKKTPIKSDRQLKAP